MSEMSKQNKNNNLIQGLSRPIDYLCYRLKIKIIEYLSKSTMHQTLKLKTLMC